MPSDATAAHPPPSALFEELFEHVQAQRIFPDSKTFPDLIPLESPEIILDRYRRAGSLERDQLRRFVSDHFRHVAPTEHLDCPPGQDLVGRIQGLWNVFVRQPAPELAHGSLIQTGHAYVVPGGRFMEAYYWDSYFSLLGLMVDGREAEAVEIVQGFASLIRRFGFIPNGTRAYYLGRSQPPLFYLMVEMTHGAGLGEEALSLLVREHAFWMSGADGLSPGHADRRVVRLSDGSLLNRYWDDFARPRDESYAEDRALAAAGQRPEHDVYRHLRAGAESGWDFSSRWLDDGSNLGSIRTTAILPIDLNAFLWSLERSIETRATLQGDRVLADRYGAMAARRAKAIRTWLRDDLTAVFCDYDWELGERRPGPTAALVTPLFVGLADLDEAAAAAGVVETSLLRAGGLVTSLVHSGQQWDAPNGWAPLQWIAVMGLTRYGHTALAETIADRWLAMVHRVFDQTGQFFEKYDVESAAGGGAGGEYIPQNGFGWTNGVTLALLHWRSS